VASSEHHKKGGEGAELIDTRAKEVAFIPCRCKVEEERLVLRKKEIENLFFGGGCAGREELGSRAKN